jgi:hypothetical protein
MQVKKIWAMSALAVVTMLTACGGGGSAGGSTPSLTGTVAVGAPMANATITVKDGAGNTKTTTTDTNGKYTISDVSTLKAPLMLQAKGQVTGRELTLHSVLETTPTASSVLNATPATEAITAHAMGNDPASVFADQTKIANINANDLKAAKTKLTEAIAEVLKAMGQDSTKIDLFTTAFNADNTGLDKLLDFVSFEGDSTNMRLVNKITNASVAVTKTDATPAKLPTLTSAEKELDTKSIKDLMTSLNAILSSEASIKAGIPSLISANFLQEGDDKQAAVSSYASYLVGAKYTAFLIRSCSVLDETICFVDFSIQKANGIVAIDPTAIKYENNKWVLYGDHSPFRFDLKPVVNASYAVSNGAANNGSFKTGMNLSISALGTTGFSSATLSYSTDNGSNWVLLQNFAAASICGSLSAIGVNTNDAPNGGNCSNFFEVDDATANTLNAAQAQGKYQLMIEVFTAPSTTASKTFIIAGHKLFTKASGTTAAKNSGMSITTTQLGTSSVDFNGSNIEYLDIGGNTFASFSWEEDDVLTLNKNVSITKANAACKAQNPSDSSCDNRFASDEVINRILLVKRDLQGRAVWMTFYK